ncbi:IS66 family transposase [Burkholderia pseudomallei]|uniref:IS66 family transposase n=1 Tax=Burkholderia pseudomallei TaxID=28450 RepID=UPI002468D51F|nr:transposase [Burkholderia pseudomallei]
MLIGKLFAAEVRRAKGKPERRQQLRARYGARVLAVIERMLVEHLPMRRAVESLGKALQSISGQWRKLEFMKSSLIEAPRERLAPTP